MKIICKFGFNYEIHKKEKEKKSPPPTKKYKLSHCNVLTWMQVANKKKKAACLF